MPRAELGIIEDSTRHGQSLGETLTRRNHCTYGARGQGYPRATIQYQFGASLVHG
jgi:hypothetical protein